MLIAAVLAIGKGWQIHRGEMAVLAYGLGVMALVVGVWHLTRKAAAADCKWEQRAPIRITSIRLAMTGARSKKSET